MVNFNSYPNALSYTCYKNEWKAGYVWGKINSAPVYAIDFTFPDNKLEPEETIKHDLTKIKDIKEISPFHDFPCFRKINNLQKRNEFMAKSLDLLAQINTKSLIVHIGGANHVVENKEGVPIHKLVKNFDKIKGFILCRERNYSKDNYFWIDGIDNRIRRKLKKGKILFCNEYWDKKFISKNYVF